MELSRLKEALHYDPDSGVFIWKEGGVHTGKPAGTVWRSRKGDLEYQVLHIEGKRHYAHRLAWLYMTGEEPPAQIDHKDGDGLNNEWENLRDGTSGTNLRNRKKHKNNTSGYTGVYWVPKSGKWQAAYVQDSKTIYVGLFSDKEDAAIAVQEARLENGFTERHGH